MTTAIEEQPVYDVSTIDDPDALVLMMRRLNDELTPDRAGGVVWNLLPNAESAAGLVAGVNGAVGCLTWEAEDGTEFVPAGGSNDGEVDYFTWDGHHFVQPPRAEVPTDTVFDAVRELVTTGRRPTCVQWTEAQP
ncbi:Immunity protein Imm1 [Prauserella aidingensis]|uniref:Imm1 family immunity protein n=1 Tax=Prauserella aidingensis TaxID=387890 RepID=UPI0020A29181|nr:Imm1 family immunity protein [Prauserella aidingensis]MCP2252378.1 Immunity protein Imm1 [Prauserella aidingensis]